MTALNTQCITKCFTYNQCCCVNVLVLHQDLSDVFTPEAFQRYELGD